jgi:hypothetical protein
MGCTRLKIISAKRGGFLCPKLKLGDVQLLELR